MIGIPELIKIVIAINNSNGDKKIARKIAREKSNVLFEREK